MNNLYEEIIQRAMQKAHTWHDLRVKINNDWHEFSPMDDVKAAYELYLERVSFALSLVDKYMGEYDELARLLIDLYTAGYIFKNVIYEPTKHWGEHPREGLWDGRMMGEWRNYRNLWHVIHHIFYEDRNGTKDFHFHQLSDYVSTKIEDAERKIELNSLTGTTKLNKEIYIVFLGVYKRLVDFYHKHTTYTFNDFDRVVEDLYRNQDDGGFHRHCEFILRRIMQEINKKEEYYSNEARYWQEHNLTQQWTSRLPQEIAQNVWTHVREDITEDQETRAMNTPRFLRIP